MTGFGEERPVQHFLNKARGLEGVIVQPSKSCEVNLLQGQTGYLIYLNEAKGMKTAQEFQEFL